MVFATSGGMFNDSKPPTRRPRPAKEFQKIQKAIEKAGDHEVQYWNTLKEALTSGAGGVHSKFDSTQDASASKLQELTVGLVTPEEFKAAKDRIEADEEAARKAKEDRLREETEARERAERKRKKREKKSLQARCTFDLEEEDGEGEGSAALMPKKVKANPNLRSSLGDQQQGEHADVAKGVAASQADNLKAAEKMRSELQAARQSH